MEPVTISLDDIVIDGDAPEAQIKAAQQDLKFRDNLLAEIDDAVDEYLEEEALRLLEDF